MKSWTKLVLLATIPLSSVSLSAESPEIKKIPLNSKDVRTTDDRIRYFSKVLLEKKYKLNPLGEGAGGKFDQDPLFRFDSFDCTTFVETILALTISKRAGDFQKNMSKIRYKNDLPSFSQRNHFPQLDWMTSGFNKKLI